MIRSALSLAAVTEVVLLFIHEAVVRRSDVDTLLENRFVAERLDIRRYPERLILRPPLCIDVLDLELDVCVHDLLFRITKSPPHEHGLGDRALVGESVGVEAGADVVTTEEVVREGDRPVLHDVDHLRVDRAAQGVHSWALDSVAEDEARNHVEEATKLVASKVTPVVAVCEIPNRKQVGPHAVRRVGENEQATAHRLGELVGRALSPLPKAEKTLEVTERTLVLQHLIGVLTVEGAQRACGRIGNAQERAPIVHIAGK